MIGPCRICAREIRAGFGFSPSRMKPIAWTDSAACCALAAKLYGKDEEMTEHEKQARAEAMKVAFGYLDKQGVTDLNAIDAERYQIFSDALFETYHERLFDLVGGNQIPF